MSIDETYDDATVAAIERYGREPRRIPAEVATGWRRITKTRATAATTASTASSAMPTTAAVMSRGARPACGSDVVLADTAAAGVVVTCGMKR